MNHKTSDKKLGAKAARSHPLPLSSKGMALAIGGACLFSTKPIIIKFAYGYPIDAVTLMTLRMAFSLPFYLVFAALALAQHKRDGIKTDLSAPTLAKIALIGLLGYYIASYLDLVGLTMVTAQFERLILFTYPSFVILLGVLFLGRKVTLKILASMALTYGGLLIIFTRDFQIYGQDLALGAAFIFGAAVTFAGYITFSQSLIKRTGSRLFTCIAMIAASLAILVHFVLTHEVALLVQPLPVYGLTFLIALLATVIPSFLIAAAIEEIGSGPTATLSGVGPVFTTLLGISLLGEPFTLWHFAGMALVIIGVLVLSQKRPALSEN
ncbi:MAG: DMT family transporter [Hyphomicrobiaceae bacterium]|nr:DMT family transporter [Hyphomicrobiaceae bacterium]